MASLAATFVCTLAACGPVDRGSANHFTSSGEIIALSGGDAGAANACIVCHGIDGLGNGAGSPRLAALDRGYLAAQLDAYATGRRRNPEMEAISRRLTRQQQEAVSAYYANLPFKPPSASTLPGPIAALYEDGDPARSLPSCASCHGRDGEGVGPANPPLGGQPAAYLNEQLDQWRNGTRRSDPNNEMLRIARMLTPAEAAALSDYASRLPGGLPHPESLEAFREARRAGPRNDASAPRPRAGERSPAA